tara:strand:- start:309 stop:788 length:480 start_codon:yes stop_codon:yes gene_type:complete
MKFDFSIRTHFQGATDTNGDRIIAKLVGPADSDMQQQITVPYRYELDGGANHYFAAYQLIQKWGWRLHDPEEMVCQSLDTGYLFIHGSPAKWKHSECVTRGCINEDEGQCDNCKQTMETGFIDDNGVCMDCELEVYGYERWQAEHEAESRLAAQKGVAS